MKKRLRVMVIGSVLVVNSLTGCGKTDTQQIGTPQVSHSDTYISIDAASKEHSDNITVQPKSEEYNNKVINELNEAIKNNEANKDKLVDKHEEVTEDKEKYFTYHSTEISSTMEFTEDKPDSILEIATVDEKLAATLYDNLVAFCEINSLDISTLVISNNKDFPVQFTDYYSYIFNISGIEVYAVCNPTEGCYITIL